jgi:predicted secreted protein
MPAPLAVAAFFTIWWISLFVVLPLAARSGPEEVQEAETPAGVDRGAPISPRLLRVAVWTTALAAAIFVVVDALAYWMG